MRELVSVIKNLPKHFKTALINIWRNGAMSFSSIFAVMITLALIGVIGVLALNVQDISENIEEGVRIYVKLERNIDENAEKAVGEQIADIKGVKSAVYSSKDDEFDCFKAEEAQFDVEFVEENELTVELPEIKNKTILTKLKAHPMWNEFNSRCISCGACTIACATCTCFTTTDIAYNENPNVGERKRTSASCQIEGFTDMAGGHTFRPTAGDRMRYKVLHKFHDYKARFKDYHMCVGCGRCIDRCPEFISIVATVEKMNAAIKEIEKEEA